MSAWNQRHLDEWLRMPDRVQQSSKVGDADTFLDEQ